MNYNDFVLIGAGIAGLQMALDLKNTYNSVVILEKGTGIGGRVYTKTFQKYTFESGAGRFSSRDTLLFNLIKKYKLDKNVISIGKPNTNQIIKKLLEAKSQFAYAELFHLTAFQYLQKVLTPLELTSFLSQYPYKTEIYVSNAMAGLIMIENDFYSKEFYVLKGGLQQVTENMKDEFLQKGGRIYTNSLVSSILQNKLDNHFKINYSDTKTKKVRSLLGKKIVLCIPPKELKALQPNTEIIQNLSFLNFVHRIPLIRVYFLYNNPIPLLAKIKKTVTDLDIGYIIPINKQIIMISYTEGKQANLIDTLYKKDKDEFLKKILDESEIILGFRLEKPDKMYVGYWENGVHVWGPGINQFEIYDKIINPYHNIYLCNEAYSKKQGWIESSLEMAKDVFDSMKNN